ncbi:hypothetical protein [Adhaeribacter aquaticus]|uniref:hypothetical protein n=1 Tax=Adhaeribacter aquaticus TaxID=299567 RepID=UPI00040C5B2A|nr:hypothetical protein [Adhaeribacter aquaticus]
MILTIYATLLPYLFLPYIYWDSRQDYKAILADGSKDSLRSKWHRQGATIRMAVIAGFCLPLVANSLLSFWAGELLLFFEFWLVFDLLLNIHRGKSLLYVGQTAAIDKFFRRFNHHEVVMLTAKLIGLFISFYLFYNATIH